MSDNRELKQLVYAGKPASDLPYSSPAAVAYQQGTSMTAHRLGNTFRQMVDNDLYIEKTISELSSRQVGPKSFSAEDISNKPNGYKAWAAQDGEHLSVLHKIDVPFSQTLDITSVKTATRCLFRFGERVFAGTDVGLFASDDGIRFEPVSDHVVNSSCRFGGFQFLACEDGVYAMAETGVSAKRVNANVMSNCTAVAISPTGKAYVGADGGCSVAQLNALDPSAQVEFETINVVANGGVLDGVSVNDISFLASGQPLAAAGAGVFQGSAENSVIGKARRLRGTAVYCSVKCGDAIYFGCDSGLYDSRSYGQVAGISAPVYSITKQGQYVFCGSDGRVFSVNVLTSQKSGEYDVGFSRITSICLISSTSLLFVDSDGRLMTLNIKSGTVQPSAITGVGSIASSGSTVYAQSSAAVSAIDVSYRGSEQSQAIKALNDYIRPSADVISYGWSPDGYEYIATAAGVELTAGGLSRSVSVIGLSAFKDLGSTEGAYWKFAALSKQGLTVFNGDLSKRRTIPGNIRYVSDVGNVVVFGGIDGLSSVKNDDPSSPIISQRVFPDSILSIDGVAGKLFALGYSGELSAFRPQLGLANSDTAVSSAVNAAVAGSVAVVSYGDRFDVYSGINLGEESTGFVQTVSASSTYGVYQNYYQNYQILNCTQSGIDRYACVFDGESGEMTAVISVAENDYEIPGVTGIDELDVYGLSTVIGSGTGVSAIATNLDGDKHVLAEAVKVIDGACAKIESTEITSYSDDVPDKPDDAGFGSFDVMAGVISGESKTELTFVVNRIIDSDALIWTGGSKLVSDTSVQLSVELNQTAIPPSWQLSCKFKAGSKTGHGEVSVASEDEYGCDADLSALLATSSSGIECEFDLHRSFVKLLRDHTTYALVDSKLYRVEQSSPPSAVQVADGVKSFCRAKDQGDLICLTDRFQVIRLLKRNDEFDQVVIAELEQFSSILGNAKLICEDASAERMFGADSQILLMCGGKIYSVSEKENSFIQCEVAPGVETTADVTILRRFKDPPDFRVFASSGTELSSAAGSGEMTVDSFSPPWPSGGSIKDFIFGGTVLGRRHYYARDGRWYHCFSVGGYQPVAAFDGLDVRAIVNREYGSEDVAYVAVKDAVKRASYVYDDLFDFRRLSSWSAPSECAFSRILSLKPESGVLVKAVSDETAYASVMSLSSSIPTAVSYDLSGQSVSAFSAVLPVDSASQADTMAVFVGNDVWIARNGGVSAFAYGDSRLSTGSLAVNCASYFGGNYCFGTSDGIFGSRGNGISPCLSAVPYAYFPPALSRVGSVLSVGNGRYFIGTDAGVYSLRDNGEPLEKNMFLTSSGRYAAETVISLDFQWGRAIACSDGNRMLSSADGRRWGTLLEVTPASKINAVYQSDRNTVQIATDAGVFSTRSKYVLSNDVQRFTEKDAFAAYEAVEPELQSEFLSALDGHISSSPFAEHLSSSLISFVNVSCVSTDFSGVDLGGWVSKALSGEALLGSNDVVLDMAFGTREDGVVGAEVSNFLTSTANAECSYVMKRYASGVTELYVYLPTTNTYYIGHVDGLPDCACRGKAFERYNIRQAFGPDAAVIDSAISSHYTEFSIHVDSSEFDIEDVLGVQVAGNSLPLKVYKGKQDDYQGARYEENVSELFHTLVQPSIVLTPVTDVRPDETGDYVFRFACFGSDAQAVKFTFYDPTDWVNAKTVTVVFHGNGAGGDGTRSQRFRLGAEKRLRKNGFAFAGKARKTFNGWTRVKDPVPLERPEYADGQLVMFREEDGYRNGQVIDLYAIWIDYAFSADDTTFQMRTDGTRSYIAAGEIVEHPDLGNSALIKYSDGTEES